MARKKIPAVTKSKCKPKTLGGVPIEVVKTLHPASIHGRMLADAKVRDPRRSLQAT